MNILILNWRDIKNPHAGGAEQITQRYAHYWTKGGHTVCWISNTFSDSLKEESINGVKIMRVGPMLTRSTLNNLFVYPLFFFKTTFLTMKIIKEHKIDLVVDEIHGLPFFTPFFVKTRKVLLVCEVAGEIWDKMWPFPVNVIGKLLEKFIYRIYERTEMWAISQNTKSDILKLNGNAGVKILPLGIEIKEHKKSVKTSYPSAVFVARLVPMKGIESALEAAAKIIKKLPDFKLYIIGRGTEEYETVLKDRVKKLGLQEAVQFLGFVTEADKYKYLSQSHFLLHPSYKEGFGLTILEAGLVGTPSIVKKGSSLDELVTHGEDGYIVNSAEEMAERFIKSYKAKEYEMLVKSAKKKTLSFAWEKQLKESDEVTLIL